MIPVRLTIEGIFSYRKPQVIDFERLTASGLFGIFGKVGSGKSSIPEAITLALYGEVNRMGPRDMKYNIMNLRSDKMLVDFIFRAGRENREYRFIYEVTRKKKNRQEIDTPKRSAYVHENGEWKPLPHNNAEEIIGLNRTNFSRTIIIPQGKFSEFLQLPDKERAQMLQDIFRLHEYDLGDKVNAAVAATSGKTQHLQGQLQGMGLPSEEEWNQLQTDIVLTEQQVSFTGKAYQQAEQAKNNAERIFREQQLLIQKKKEWQELTAREESILTLEKDIQTYILYQQHFGILYTRLNDGKSKIAPAQEKISQLEIQLRENEELLKGIQQQLTAVRPLYEQSEQWQEKIIGMENVARWLEGHQEILKRDERLQNAENHIREQATLCNNLKTQWQQLKEEIRSAREKLPDGIAIAEAIHREKSIAEKEEQARETAIELQLLSERLVNLEKNTDEIKTRCLALWQTVLSTFSTTAIENVIEKERQQLLEKERTVAIRENIHHLALDLREGEPCPLCGSTSHPDPFTIEQLQASPTELNQQLQAFSEKEKQTRQNLREIEGLLVQVENTRENILKKTKEAEKIQEQITTLNPVDTQETLAGIGLEALLQIEKNYRQTELTVKEAEKTSETVQQQLTEQEVLLKKYETAHAAIQAEKNTLEQQNQALQKEIHVGILEEFRTMPVEEIRQKALQIRQSISDTREKFSEYTSATHDLEKKRESLLSGLQLQKELLENLVREQKEYHRQWQQKITELEVGSPENIVPVLESNRDITAANTVITEYRHQKSTLASTLEMLEKSLDGVHITEEEMQHILEAFSRISREKEEIFNRAGALYERQKKITETRQQAELLQKELAHWEERMEGLAILRNMFRGMGFVNFVARKYLHILIHTANRRFHPMTGRQFMLEMDAENRLRIRDYMNGGELRSVSSLSGGQTFQASLCMALALAESVQVQSENERNFFFLDEGFGSLDEETLTIVMDTLRQLRKENRIVGLISHVDQLQEQIDVYLRVVNDPEKGSLLLTE